MDDTLVIGSVCCAIIAGGVAVAVLMLSLCKAAARGDAMNEAIRRNMENANEPTRANQDNSMGAS